MLNHPRNIAVLLIDMILSYVLGRLDKKNNSYVCLLAIVVVFGGYLIYRAISG